MVVGTRTPIPHSDQYPTEHYSLDILRKNHRIRNLQRSSPYVLYYIHNQPIVVIIIDTLYNCHDRGTKNVEGGCRLVGCVPK